MINTDVTSTIIGRNIRNSIKGKHITQKQIANMADITECSLSRIIDGIQIPRLDTALRLANAVGVSLEDFVKGVEL